MKLLTRVLVLLLAAPFAFADDDPPIVEELFLTEAPWTQGRGDVQLTGVFGHAGHDSDVGGQVEYGVSDRVQLDLEVDRTLPDVGQGESEIEIGASWAIRPDMRRGALAIGFSLAQLSEEASFTFQASAGHRVGDGGALVADVVVPLEEGVDAALHGGYVHRVGASWRLLAEAELALGHPRNVSLAPGLAWKPSEAVELGAAVVFPLRDGYDTGVVAQATIEF